MLSKGTTTVPMRPAYVDLQCNHASCENKDHYILDGRCANCGWSGYLWITLGHTGREATSTARCPRCDCRGALSPGAWVD